MRAYNHTDTMHTAPTYKVHSDRLPSPGHNINMYNFNRLAFIGFQEQMGFQSGLLNLQFELDFHILVSLIVLKLFGLFYNVLIQ